jgi:F-type H+-transporting ATPase subunit b
MANFLILMLVLNIIFFNPLRKHMNSRKQLIESLKLNADIAKTYVEEGEAQRERFRVEVLLEGVKFQSDLKEEGRAKETSLLEEAQKQAADRVELARQALTVQVETVRQELRSEAQVLASHLVNKLLGREAEPEH